MKTGVTVIETPLTLAAWFMEATGGLKPSRTS